MQDQFRDFVIRAWQPTDRQVAAEVIRSVLAEYGIGWEPDGADRDVYEVETAYLQVRGAFWVVEQQGQVVGTAAFYPVNRGVGTVEIRKMYLLPQVRGKGLGRWLLQRLEQEIAAQGFREVWIETASVLKEAVKLYESSGYLPATGIETERCDLIYSKVLQPEQ
ncbi:GNAT family N-acetyltransferase [Acaryochloris sp. 'Moss Beach']|uniref:GNAT family N-acetyltransferase n=1 Tax=Acaryochloris sp. 'Moss Beach' TaxID=2740837 RepID=UPI001F456B1B|nr:GNAT family N-acetyltransferase [Acaryochloris sp. 'Moss Beach']UJB71583.1 GNAT family N-acetyltransferase [Acaryochloris sp. 'Moss Beach']